MTLNADFHIFRDSRRSLPANELLTPLRHSLCNLPTQIEGDSMVSLLLLAGELERGLADAQAPLPVVGSAMRLTGLFATLATGREPISQQIAAQALPLLNECHYAGQVSVSPPEGFAYYALHPLDYADLAAGLRVSASHALVIGIRSIGTTLSAVVAAKLSALGIAAKRTTVRPGGHPYDRTCHFDLPQRQAIGHALANDAEFLVCDEGPGRSGSSLLSVAEALEAEGVPSSRITILCSHQPDVAELCGRNAARRWFRYRSAAPGMTHRLPAGAECFLGGGEWRRKFIPVGEPWPAVWPQMERLKYLSRNGHTVFTFEGHGPYGAAVERRSQALSDAGFSPRYLGHHRGFGSHALPASTSVRRHELTPQLLRRMAEYCAWRAREFRADCADTSELENAVRTNFEREFGSTLHGLVLPVERPAICDSRMQPHHWLRTANGNYRKLDAAIHGDDHFWPGPCDIAWDLAGAVVEWELDDSARGSLLAQYASFSGDYAMPRIAGYELAYATFRLAWSKMAAVSTPGTDEEPRLIAEYLRYRERVATLRDLETHPAEAVVTSSVPRLQGSDPSYLL